VAEATLDIVPDPRSLAQAMIDTVRAPLLVLDEELRVIAASRSYYAIFRTDQPSTQGLSIYDIAAGQWDVPDLRALLDAVLWGGAAIEAYEIQIVVPEIGSRTLILDARRVLYTDASHISVLLGFEDVTALRITTREKDDALLQKSMLLQEMQHRVANSLQIIASILLMKARGVASEETRDHLRDAHRRVMSVATVQAHLQASLLGDAIEIGPYLTTLCEGLAKSMIHDQRPVDLRVRSGPGAMTSARAVSLGLIVTELVINALKYAFSDGEPGVIAVDYVADDAGWRLAVTDDGPGLQAASSPELGQAGGLGSSLIAALAAQLGGRIERVDAGEGLTVAIVGDSPGGPIDAGLPLELTAA
jgi:chemotaxis protein methyltransferase CheR